MTVIPVSLGRTESGLSRELLLLIEEVRESGSDSEQVFLSLLRVMLVVESRDLFIFILFRETVQFLVQNGVGIDT